ncbi:anti-sigma factor [Stenotrophomonas sp. 24(2023)]|uniref:anti-sigma factor family protein n=1 Tax=Stenotrophomonas sp. 24(2023) TaxID=3068324 RepID=UPI0027E123F4|nr:anti-sigma factor [Stenotrophomonas sp. 24(2023)]WMJ71226.1 anti-sigma factor [Stenotrophomonas sp. 24(2023)]
MNITPPTDEELHAHVDGRLDPARQAEVLAWLQAHPEQQARIDDWVSDVRGLRAAWAGTEASASLPAAFDLAATRRRVVARRRQRLGMVAACALTLCVGTGLGWQLRAGSEADHLPMADAVSAYRLFAAGGVPLEFNAGGRQQLDDWLRDHFGSAADVPDLSAQGYRLQGGRLLSTAEGAAAMLVYEAEDGGRIGLYVRPRTTRALPVGERRDGRLLAQYWSRDGVAFALVGPAESMRTQPLAPLLRGAG